MRERRRRIESEKHEAEIGGAVFIGHGHDEGQGGWRGRGWAEDQIPGREVVGSWGGWGRSKEHLPGCEDCVRSEW